MSRKIAGGKARAGVSRRQRRVWRSRSEWGRLFAAQERSGLSVAAFCRREGIVASVFYRARKQIDLSEQGQIARRSAPNASAQGQVARRSAPNTCEPVSSRTFGLSLMPDKAPGSGKRFIELRVAEPRGVGDPGAGHDQVASSGVEVIAGDGLRIALSRGFDAPTLVRAVEALAGLQAASLRDSVGDPHSIPEVTFSC